MSKKNSTAVNFTLQKSISIPPFCIADGNLSHQPEMKLLRVIFNQHTKFDSHIDAVIEKTKSATHAMVKLKQSVCPGGRYSTEPEFYQSYLIQHHAGIPIYQIIAKLNERYQKYITRLTLHDEEDYDNRLSVLKFSELNIHLQILCFHFVLKVSVNEDHQCHKFLTKHISILIEPPSLTIIFSISSLKDFFAIFSLIHGLIYYKDLIS